MTRTSPRPLACVVAAAVAASCGVASGGGMGDGDSPLAGAIALDGGDLSPGEGSGGDGDVTAGDAALCPLGSACNPIPVATFPFTDERDTVVAPSDVIDRYGCAPATDESGPEFFYQVTLAERGVLIATLGVGAGAGNGVDIDIHLLGDSDPLSCIARGHITAGRLLDAGSYLLVADTWVDLGGNALAGAYTLSVTFFPLASGACAQEARDLAMRWPDGCDPLAVDCYDVAGMPTLRTPAYGAVVMEAHLVSDADGFAGAWPQSPTDGLANHHAISEAATCLQTTRDQAWAPQEGSEFGQGATGAYLPLLHEAWYVNMYWQVRPAKGTRMLVLDPSSGKAVVAAGGYETGPLANTAIGGAVEEIHRYLGTSHRAPLLMGFLVDATLPLGPIDCASGAPVTLCP